jgi:Tol biopolymer transport system component
MSGDGRFVVVGSTSPYLKLDVLDLNEAADLFLWDRTTGGLTLISRAFDSPTRTADGTSYAPVISPDGAYVAFASKATNLLPPQAGAPVEQSYVWERSTGAIRLASHAPGNPLKWDTSGVATWPGTFSADGRYLTLRSTSWTLVPWMPVQAIQNAFLWDRDTGEVSLITRAPGPGPVVYSGNQDSGAGAISADGRYVSISTASNNLLPGMADNAGGGDVFLWDRLSGSFTLVSHSLGSPMQAGNRGSGHGWVSADGNYVVFSSTATNIAPNQVTTPYAMVFLWERATGTIRLVSHTLTSQTAASNDNAQTHGFSADGRFVLFISADRDLLPSPSLTPAAFFAHLWDRADGSITLVTHEPGSPTTALESWGGPWLSEDGSRVAFGGQAYVPSFTSAVYSWERATGEVRVVSHAVGSPTTLANGDGGPSAISDDGRFIAFASNATNLVPGGPIAGDWRQSYQWDAANGQVTLLAPRPGAGPTSRGGTAAAVSADGRFVVFSSYDAGQASSDPRNAYLWDRATGAEVLITHIFGSPTTPFERWATPTAISDDGEFVVFHADDNDLIPPGSFVDHSQAFLWQRSSGLISLISHVPSSAIRSGNWPAQAVTMTPGAESVVFQSAAPNLVAGGSDTNNDDDLYVWERATGNVRLVSHAWAAPLLAGRRGAEAVAISRDGRFVVFNSAAEDMVPGDINQAFDVFVWDRSDASVTLVSHKPSAFNTPASGGGWAVGASGDGEFVLFLSRSAELVAGQQNPLNTQNAFLWQRSTGVVRLVTHMPGNATLSGNRDSAPYSITPDGAHVVLFSSADVDPTGLAHGYMRWDRATEQWTQLGVAGPIVAVSDDARRVLYRSVVAGPLDGNGAADIFLWDSGSMTSTLVSHTWRNALATGDRGSDAAAMSRDGRFVAYSSAALDLVFGEIWPRATNAYLWFAGTGVAPAFTSPGATTMTALAANSFTVTAAGDPPPTLSSASPLPAGLTLIDQGGGAAALAGAPVAGTSGVHALTFRASNGIEPDATQNFALTIHESPRFTSGTSASFSPGIPGAFTVTTGGFPAGDLSQSGTLPGGLAFVDHGDGTGEISGTAAPFTFGRYPIQLTAQNGYLPDALQNLVVTVDSGEFFVVSPCRVFDSRTVADAPALSSGATRIVQLAGRCGIPAAARSVVLNLTSVGATGEGYLQAFAGDQAPPSTSALSLRAGTTRANNATAQLALDGSGTLALRAIVTNGGTVDVVIDVSGYFE